MRINTLIVDIQDRCPSEVNGNWYMEEVDADKCDTGSACEECWGNVIKSLRIGAKISEKEYE